MEAKKEIMLQRLQEILGEDHVFPEEPMCRHITFRVGGPAEWFVHVDTIEQLKQVIVLCKEQQEPYYVIGNGSDLLVSDTGVRGVIIRLTGEFETVTPKESVNDGICNICAGAGVMLAALSLRAGKKGFTGLEFANGIPGTVGGAVLMNAGAYGGEIKDTIVAADVLTKDGEIRCLKREELDLSYRHSAMMESGDIILKAYFTLSVRPKLQIFAVMESYRKARQEKQPLEYPSAGSTFKRPQGHFAGKLIQDAGLSGFRVGGAMVSTKHAGFVINAEHATAADIYQLIQHIRQTVKEKFQVELEPEVRFLGAFDE
ncbi:MAG: UDP-N-acetylmuramate dehydrogenase [Lachnospiraceae bacterium]|nr:UDP-N-acetylmuramate dehydrogenase [Lachnospiraceae bacterium]